MTFRNRPSSAGQAARTFETIIRAAICIGVLVCFIRITDAPGAVYTRRSFPVSGDGIADSNMTTANEALGLAVSHYTLLKLFGDAPPSLPAVTPTFFPDVAAGSDGTFAFFWADSQGILKRIYRMQEGGAAPAEAPLRIAGIVPGNACYLHADNGGNGYLASYVATDGPVRRLQACNGTVCRDLDSTTSIFCYSSQCAVRNDTYCIAYVTNLETLTILKVYALGTEIRTIASTVAATGAPVNGQALMNPSIAADGDGTIAVSWAKGGLQTSKNLYCRFFDRDLRPLGAETLLATDICRRDTMHYYDNAPIVSYRPGRFALAHWDSAGVLVHTVAASGASFGVSSARIVERPDVRFTAIAGWRGFIVVLCKGDVDNDGSRGVEGFKFEIKNGEPDLSGGTMIRFSDPLVPDTTKDRFSASLNCAFDTAGNMALAWRQGPRATFSIWSNRGIRHARGFWTSPVESLSVATGDSTRFYPGIVAMPDPASSWYAEDSIRRGRSPSDFSPSNPWTSLSSTAVLDTFASDKRFFQFRITVNRKSHGDSVISPAIAAIFIPWNAKPLVAALDSIKVNGSPLPGCHFGDTVTVISRRDSLTAFLRLRDADSTGRLTVRASWPAVDTALGCASGPGVEAAVRFSNMPRSDTVVACTIAVIDSFGWTSDPACLRLHARNSPPRLRVNVVHRATSGALDTVPLASDGRFDVQSDDSIAFLYSVADTNDSAIVKAYLYRADGGAETALDSVTGGAEKRYVVYGTALPAADSAVLSVVAKDPDTSVRKRAAVVVNHLPSVSGITIDGKTVRPGDTVRVGIGKRADIAVAAIDADLAYWDTLECRFATKEKTYTAKGKTTVFEYTLLPGLKDTLVDITVRDLYGRIAAARFYLKYPWLALDSAANPAYVKALDSLSTAFSLVVGGNVTDSVTVPLLNTGNDTMYCTSLCIPDSAGRWLSVGIPQGGVTMRFTAATAPQLEPALIRPGEALRCIVYADADSFRGDGAVYGRFILGASDVAHPFDTVPARLVYNDLPRIQRITPEWDSTKPYTPGGIGKKNRPSNYRFPPHAAIGIVFSEPVDSASAVRGLRVYSVFDSAAAGAAAPIPVIHAWTANHTRLTLIADYKAESQHFKLRPPPRLFIPTDSITLEATTALTDLAATPGGPNALDIDGDYNCDSSGSAFYPMRVDSITFCLLSTSPADGDTGVPPGTPLLLAFSAPVLRSSIDTARSNNRSLVIVSRYSDGAQIPYDSVTVRGNAVRFYPGVRLFYNDSVRCRYRGASIHDAMGFPSDNTHDGIPVSLFDSLTAAEDVAWRFRVKGINVLSVSPANGDSVSEIARPIVLTFSDKVPPAAFDTSVSDVNRSFTMRSLYGGSSQSAFKRFEFSPDSTAITITTAYGYFSGDSIHCLFRGFSRNYRYGAADNLPGTEHDCFSATEWSFRTGAAGFYLYPNPYKPGKNPRHCGAGGPCGIWFKNLHSLARGTVDFRIRIFSMKALPLYDTKQAGLFLHFNPGDQPQWLWKATNRNGTPVASGVYFYAVYDNDDRALVKGKLMIVR